MKKQKPFLSILFLAIVFGAIFLMLASLIIWALTPLSIMNGLSSYSNIITNAILILLALSPIYLIRKAKFDMLVKAALAVIPMAAYLTVCMFIGSDVSSINDSATSATTQGSIFWTFNILAVIALFVYLTKTKRHPFYTYSAVIATLIYLCAHIAVIILLKAMLQLMP